MMEIRYTLLSDGSSDQALLPILTWLLRSHLDNYAIQPQWADFRRLSKSLKDTLQKRIELSVDLYPCDLLFIHRDAEREDRKTRVQEIYKAIEKAGNSIQIPIVCVVPIRMTEAWLLFDVVALRKAASNPNGKTPLQLPDIKRLEAEPDPKKILHELLRQASDRSPRRLKNFSTSDCVHRVAELIDDFSYLRNLSAFVEMEGELVQVLCKQGWSIPRNQ